MKFNKMFLLFELTICISISFNTIKPMHCGPSYTNSRCGSNNSQFDYNHSGYGSNNSPLATNYSGCGSKKPRYGSNNSQFGYNHSGHGFNNSHRDPIKPRCGSNNVPFDVPATTQEKTPSDYKRLLRKRKENGKNLNDPYHNKDWPLLADMINQNYNDLVEYIIKNQPDIELNEQFKNGRTYLHVAVQSSNNTAIQKLLNNKAKVDLQDNSGNTPLLLAGQGIDQFLISRLLLCNNANPNIFNTNDISPIDLPVKKVSDRDNVKSNRILANLLITFGANINTTQKSYPQYLKDIVRRRDEIIEKVKNNQPIEYETIKFALCYIKDTNGNNLVHHALLNHNWNVFNKLMHLRPEMIVEQNFQGEAPIDFIQNVVSADFLELFSESISEPEIVTEPMEL